MWKCDWRKTKEERKDIRNFVAKLDLVEALNPCDAFCGGGTNAVKLYHLTDIASEEKINYYDFTSLYPFINKNAQYPVGHPEIIFQPEDTNIQNYFGIAKVTILSLEKLFHPVLPLRENGNSHSHYAEPVYRKRWKNQCYNAPGFAFTATVKDKLQVHGVPLN